MPIFEAIRLALSQIRVQKLKSFFTLLGVTISVMFLIAVVSIVEGMAKYVEQDFAAKFLGVNVFNVRRFPDINGNVTEAEWRAWQRRPRITPADGFAIRDALPPEARWALHDITWGSGTSAFRNGGPQIMAQAVTPEFFRIKDLVVEKGRAFTDQDDLHAGDPALVRFVHGLSSWPLRWRAGRRWKGESPPRRRARCAPSRRRTTRRRRSR